MLIKPLPVRYVYSGIFLSPFQSSVPARFDIVVVVVVVVVYRDTFFRKLSSIYVFSYFPFGFEGRIWDLIVSVPDHCLSFYFVLTSMPVTLCTILEHPLSTLMLVCASVHLSIRFLSS